MTNVIVVTSIKEQQDVMSYLQDRLKELYLTDTSIEIVKRTMTRIDVYQQVKGMKHLAASYYIILMSIGVDYTKLVGFSHNTNIDITRALRRLNSIKDEMICFVNKKRMDVKKSKDSSKDLSDAMERMFG